MTSYLMIVSDGERLSGKVYPARKIAVERLRRNLWPLYPRTSFASFIAEGDECFFYLAGDFDDAQSVIARSTVRCVDRWSNSDWFEEKDLLVDTPDRVMMLTDVIFSTEAVSVRPLLHLLEITKGNDRNWGSYFQGGCKKLSEADTKLIRRHMK